MMMMSTTTSTSRINILSPFAIGKAPVTMAETYETSFCDDNFAHKNFDDTASPNKPNAIFNDGRI